VNDANKSVVLRAERNVRVRACKCTVRIFI